VILTTATSVAQVMPTFDTVHVSYSAVRVDENCVMVVARHALGSLAGEVELPADLVSLRDVAKSLHRAVLNLVGD